MKKKLIVLILGLILALACALCLAACNPDSGNGGGNAYVTGVVMIDGEGAEHTEYDFGDVVYGRRPDFGSLKLYAKYSDGTKRELSGEDGDKITVTYSYNNETLPDAPTSYSVGFYGIRYEFESYSAYVSYRIVTSATATPYSISLNKLQWKYGEEPEITVRDPALNVIDKSKYSIHYIAVDEYDKIKNSEDFTDALITHGYPAYYSGSDEFINIFPGEYYFFAYFEGMGKANSNLQKVTIKKAPLIPVYADDFDGFYFANNWWMSGETGTVPISQIVLGVNTHGTLSWKTEQGENYDSHAWTIEWRDPDEQITSDINGKRRMIKCTFSDERYEDYLFPEPITVQFDKATLYVPSTAWGTTYDGADHDIVLDYNGHLYDYDIELLNKVVTIKDRNGNVVTIGENGVIATVREVGRYTFTFELKDKNNYDWRWTDYNTEGNPTVFDAENKRCEYVIRPRDSWIGIFAEIGYDLSIDENRQIVIRVNPGEDINENNVSPYVLGTLRAEILSEYSEPSWGYAERTEIEATVEVVHNDSDGLDYIIITVTDFKDVAYYLSGRLILKISATGDNHYEDINQVFPSIFIERYEDYQSITCPLDGLLDNDTLEKPAGTTVAELYTTYEEYGLVTTLGKWVLQMYVGSDDYETDRNAESWLTLGDAATLPVGTMHFRLVFQSNFVQHVDAIAPYVFTMIGTRS